MLSRAILGIRARILAIALLAFAPPAAFVIVLAVEDVWEADSDAHILLDAGTREIADRYAGAFRDIRIALSILADQPRMQRAAEVQGPECREILQSYFDLNNRSGLVKYTNLALNDVVTGLPLCSVPTGRTEEDVGRVGWFQRIVETGEIGFGGYRIGGVTGRPILIGGGLVRDNRGRPAAVLLAAADLAGATAADPARALAPGTTATVFSASGTILFRFPESDLRGRNLPDAELADAAAGISDVGAFEGPDLDGVHRTSIIRRLDAPEPTFVAVGRATADIYAPGRRLMSRLSAVLATTFLVTLAAVWFVSDRTILSPLTALATGTRRVADGDYSARVTVPGFDEMEELADSFNDMAKAIESHTIEVERQRSRFAMTAARHQTIFDAVAEGIIVRDRQGRIVDVNPAAVSILGMSRESLLGIGIDRTPPWKPVDTSGEPVPMDRYPVSQAAQTGKAERTVTLGVHRPDGTRRWISGGTSVTRDATGSIDFLISSFTDVTDRLQAEAELRQAMKMEAIGQLTGGIAHDFNNLLMVVISNLEMLEEDLAGQETQHRMAAGALKVALRGADLVRKLLTFSRRRALAPSRTNVNMLVEDLVPLLRSTIGGMIAVDTRLTVDSQYAVVDAAEFESALINLAVNARDAMPKGGSIVIETAMIAGEADGGVIRPFIEIAVRDNGDGMPAEVLARVFEPFFTTKEVGKGSGLGLAMVYGFAKQSGGSVAIESVPGKGTVVRLRLPRVESIDESASRT